MIKNLINRIIFPFCVLAFASLGITIYTKLVNSSVGFVDGFVAATPTKNNKYVCSAEDYQCIKNLIKDLNNSEKKLLIFGNSQLGAINQFSEGEINYAHQLALKYEDDDDFIVRSIWIPNVNFTEFKEIYSSIEECSLEIDNLIIPLFLDDTRDAGIRESLKDYSSKICGESNKSGLDDNRYITFDPKKNSQLFDYFILNNMPYLKEAKSLNTHFRTFLYKFRNTVFGITASSKRKITPKEYHKNISSLKELITLRKEKNLSSIIYIPPLLHYSSGKAIPYVRNEYKAFKDEMKRISKVMECEFYNFESIVNDDLWGFKETTSLSGNSKEIDFMHFTYLGHEIVFNKLSNVIDKFNK